MQNLGTTFWSPLALAVASAAFSAFYGSKDGWSTRTTVSAAICVISIICAYAAARGGNATKRVGAGGNAFASGDNSKARGGDAGRGSGGGHGGDAIATGLNSHAEGGRGGDA